jgi:hypothetical protein
MATRTPSAPLAARIPERDAASGAFRQLSIATWSRRMRIPPTRLYTVLSELGLSRIGSDDDLRRVVQHLQRGAIPFTALADLFGPEVTLFDFMRGEVLP